MCAERLMESLYISLEATSLSTWLRESPSLWAFPFVLILHTVGLAFFVGANLGRATLIEAFTQLSQRFSDLTPITEPDVEPNIFARAVRSFRLGLRRR